MAELKIKAKVENLNAVLAFVDGELEKLACPMRAQMQIDVAVEELFVNIAHYAYAPGEGDALLAVTAADQAVEIEFRDSGVPYDPLAKADPDVSLSAEERQIGGLGIFMVKKTMDDMAYRYENGQNVLKIRKRI